MINATWLNLTNDNFKCKHTEALYQNRKDADVVIKMRRMTRGCGVLGPVPKVEIGMIGYHSCLCHENFQHPKMGYFLSIYNNYQKGILPFGNSLMDQPSQIMDLIGLLDNLHTEREIELQEQERKKNKKGK